MSAHFLKFKRRLLLARICKSLMAAVAVGMLGVGAWLVLWRLALIDLDALTAHGICIGAAAVVFVAVFLLLHTTDLRLASKLDTRYGLQEKVQTMVAFRDEAGGMLELQREDAERSLARVRARAFGLRGLWAFLLVLCIGASALTLGLMTENRRDYVPPEEIVPFEISKMQIAGIEELIRYAAESDMEEPYRAEVLDALTVLLADLKLASTAPEMQAALATAITSIAETTYASSSMTEILNALWNTEEVHVRALASALNTEKWTEPDWGDFAEKYAAFCATFSPKEGGASSVADIRWTAEAVTLRLNGALDACGIAESDALYAEVRRLIDGATDDGATLRGLDAIARATDTDDAAALQAELDDLLAALSEGLYGVISAQKINTNVGEYVLQKLSALFGVAIPAFERPHLPENGGASDESDRDDKDEPSSGGVGEGVTFGSKDLVLNPLTGEYVEYGTLYSIYNGLMAERLDNDAYGYTEAQAQAIKKYFALLYSGFKDDEKGNEHE